MVGLGLPYAPMTGQALRSWFATPVSAVLTVLALGLLALAVPPLLDWLWFDARFGGAGAQACRDAGGACWAFIGEKYRLILFGLYPYDEQWRPLLASLLLLAAVLLSTVRRCWKPWLALIWAATLALAALLMWGGALGLPLVQNRLWGGLPLTLMLAVFGVALAFPLGVVLALGRRSRLPAVKALCVVYIELIRGVPLISLLFMASVMFPLFLPAGWEVDKLLRAQLAIVLFVAAYIAETVRGGLQGVPAGQYAAAQALGLGYWRQMRFVVLPQALSAVAGPLTGIFISLLKDTSLVVVIGLFDLTQAAKAAVADAQWQSYSLEAYVFIAAIYFVLCWGMSRYSRGLESAVPLSASGIDSRAPRDGYKSIET
jgi:general L-amino acid transport system permease protein